MDPIRFSIQNPVTVSVGVLLVVLFGLISLTTIPIQLTPTVETTVISVTTRWEGASPQEIEREIIREQEDKLKAIQSLAKMVATCELGEGTITLEFAQGSGRDEALREVSNKLREVPDYPENVDEPVVRATNPADRDYIAWVTVTTTDPAFDVRKLYDFFDERIKPELERVPGLAEINILGGWEREVHVRVDPRRLAQRGITMTRLAESLRRQNRNAPAGQLAEGKYDVRVRSVGRYDDLEQVRQTLLSDPGRPVVRVRDVASVELDYKEPRRIVRNKGRVVLAFNAQREVGSNVVEVMEGFQAALERLRQTALPAEANRLGLKGDIVMEQVYDQTIYIHQAVNLVLGNLVWAAVMTVTVLLVFLRSLRSMVVVALAIPISVIGVFLVMAALGRTLNVISLAGLAFAIGVVVDNAIVVLENIDRHRRLGQPGSVAAYRATREVWGAILASTLTTVAVFIPVLTVQEEAGQMFRDISLAICAAVLLSLTVAVTVIPSAASKWLGGGKGPGRLSGPARPTPRFYQFFGDLTARFAAALERLMRTRGPRLAVIGGMAAASILGAFLLMPPTSYLPAGNRNLVFAMMYSPPGYNLDQQLATGLNIEEHVRPYWVAAGDPQATADLPQVTIFDPAIMGMRSVQPPPLENFFFVALPDQMFMGGISADPRRVGPVADLLNSAIRAQPGVNGFAAQQPLFRTAQRGSGDAIELEIAGPDLSDVNRAAELVRDRLVGQFGGPQYIRPEPNNFDLLGPEVRIRAKLVEAADVGLTQQDLNLTVQVFGDGAIIGDYLHEGDTIDLKIIAEGTEKSGDPAGLRDIPVATPIGQAVPLHSVAHVERTIAPQQISRVEEQRAVTLSIEVPEERPLEEAINFIAADIESLRADGLIPATVTTNLAGSAAKLKSVKESMLGRWTGFNMQSLLSLIQSRMFLALLVTFLLMAALFESWLYPLVIMFSVPLAMVGGFAGLRLVHTFVPTQQLDVLTMLGFVILVGTVVNNAILIVHQALNLVRGDAEIEVEGEVPERLPPRKAIAEATRTRIRPIFMTTVTTVVGATPLVVFPGAGSELYRGLGAVVLGGLLVSTIFTLVLVPLLLSVVFDLREMLFRKIETTPKREEQPV